MLTRAQHRVAAAVEPIPNVGEDDAERTQLIPDRDNDDALERTQPIPGREEADRAMSQEIRNIRAQTDGTLVDEVVEFGDDDKVVQELLSDGDDDDHVPVEHPKRAMKATPIYKLSEDETDSSADHHSKHPERNSQAKTYYCGGCHQILLNNIPGQNLIGCEGKCRKWFHMNCAGVTDTDYQQVLDTNAKWICRRCTTISALPAPQVKYTDTKVPTESCCNLPDFEEPKDINKSSWGVLDGEQILKTCIKVYNEVVKWRRNLFLLPSGAVGKQFIEELNKVVSSFVSKASNESAAMTKLMIMPALLLQKPAKKSKTAQHVQALKRRLLLWTEGKLDELLREGKAIQQRLKKTKQSKEHVEQVFVRLMFQGKVSAAMRWIGTNATDLLGATDQVITDLINLHPAGKRAEQDSVLEGPIDKVEQVIFEEINGQLIQACTKKIDGAAGPSGLDSDGWKRILCSKQFGTKSLELCESIARMAIRLSTQYVDPKIIKPFTACRLVPLDKKPGVRPIGIGEVLRRIVGKAVMQVLKREMVECTAPIQVCAGIPGGVEAAVHATRRIFEEKDTEAIILVDASNAFNSLNRNAALNNIKIACPTLATYIINSYREPANLYVANSDKMILSEEGVTQGDNAAMGFYSCSTIPLIRASAINNIKYSSVNNNSSTTINDVKQVWYADDAAGGGKIKELQRWWRTLQSRGPLFGYYPKPSKTWVIVKQEHYDAAKKAFPNLNITTSGHKYLGSFIGTTEGKEAFVSEKVIEWCKDLKQLSEIASREPQVAYSAFIYGLSKRWTYVCRTTPDISELLKPLEHSITELFIPAILDRVFSCTDILRQVFSLPQRDGGLGIFNMTEISDAEYGFSIRATKQLTEAIYCQDHEYHENDEELHDVKQKIRKERASFHKEKQEKLLSEVSELGRLMINLASEKGASSWLTALPLKDFGYVLNKQQFADALALRYSFYLKDCPKICACGATNSINHALICKTGGYVSMRHNWLRNCIGKIMETAKCKDIQIEPPLLPTNGYQLPPVT